MKNFIYILCFFLSINCSFAGQYSSTLDKIENNIYGFTYMDSDDSRVTRLEQSIYGEGKSGKSLEQRVKDLNKDMSADMIGQEISPREDTFDDTLEENLAQSDTPPKGANVDYPSINELEQKLFQKENKNMDLTARLTALEKQAFGTTYDSDSFSERVDRLQAKIKPKSFMDNSIAQSSNYFYDDDIVPLDENYKLNEYSPPDFDYGSYNARHPSKVNLASVEKSMFKKTFNNDDINNRLSRLESTMFGTTFTQDTQEQRINRIASAYKATKTAGKYDSNKFTQNMATATQIGMLILMILACVL